MQVGPSLKIVPVVHSGPRPEGKQLWEQRYEPAPGEGDNKPTAMTSDSAGNIYLCGFVETVRNDTDFLTMKYAPNGKLLWSKRYNGPANDCDRARAISVDPAGYVYVTGESYGGNREDGGTQWDFATVKYDSEGHEIWARRFNGPPNNDDYAIGVGLDAKGNVYVGGTSRQADGAAHYVLIKYDPSGRPLWTERNDPNPSGTVPSNCALHDMTCDDRGNVYLTGEGVIQDGFGKKDTEYLTVCYDHNGNKIWQRRFSGDASGVDKGWRIVLDEEGSVYVAGQSELGNGTGGAGAHVVLVKYDRNGKELWTCPFRDRDGFGYPNGLTVGPGGNIYISLLAGGLGGRQILLKVDPDGKLKWAHKFSDWLGTASVMQGVASGADGSVFCTGRRLDPAKGSGFWRGDNLTCRLDENGKLLWQRSLSEVLQDGAGAHLICRDNRGAAIVASQIALRWQGVFPLRYSLLLVKYGP
jgi:Beta-propeller repeat.